MEVSLSHTSRSTFQTCKRKWYYSYVQGLRPKHKSSGLRMGTVFSDCLEARSAEVANTAYNEMLLDMAAGSGGPRVDDLVWERVVVYSLARTYLQDMPEMHREVPFRLHAGGSTINGYIDGIIVHDTGQVTIVENKLKARWTTGEEKALVTDPQVSQYVAAVMELAKTEDWLPSDLTIKDIGVRYDVTVKPGIRIRKDETPESYLVRLSGDIEARHGHYHRSFFVSRTPEQMKEFWDNLEVVADEMKREEYFAPNYSACTMYGICEFHKLCATHDTDELAIHMATYDRRDDG